MLLSDWLVATLFLFVVGTENRFLVTAGRRNCAGADVALARAMRSLLWRCSACTLILSTFINFLLSTTTLAMIRRSIAGSQASTCIHGKSTNYPRLFVFFILPLLLFLLPFPSCPLIYSLKMFCKYYDPPCLIEAIRFR